MKGGAYLRGWLARHLAATVVLSGAILAAGAWIALGGSRLPRPVATGAVPNSVPRSNQVVAPGGAGPLAVDATALKGLGRLAFTSLNRLYILDGSSGAVRAVASLGSNPTQIDGPAASDPSWSPDGDWLAFTQPAGHGLWVAPADGGEAHQLLAGGVGRFSWSPSADVLAAAGPSGLSLLYPDGERRPLLPAGTHAGDPAWSPDGQTLAYAAAVPGQVDKLYTIAAAGGEPRELPLRLGDQIGADAGIILAGWWPDGQGLLFWLDPFHSASIAADGLVLYSIPIAGGTPIPLTTTLTYPDWLTWIGRSDRLVVVAGGNREVWQKKSLTMCDVRTGHCQPVPPPAHTVALEPAASSQGDRVAVVQAMSRGNAGGWSVCSSPAQCGDRAAQALVARRTLSAWLRTRTLWLMDPNGHHAKRLDSAGTGIYDPLWSADGRSLLYVRDNGIWLLNTVTGQPVRVVYPLMQDWTPYGFYGHVDWLASMAWHR